MRKATTLLENSSVMAQHNHLGIIQTNLSVNVIIYCFFIGVYVNTSICSSGSTIVHIFFPNTDHSSFISTQLQIALQLLFIVQCNFVVKTVRTLTLNKRRSSKLVLSGYFREFLHAGSGKYMGETGTMHEKLNFHKFLRTNYMVQTKRKSKAKTGKYRICIPVYFNMGS